MRQLTANLERLKLSTQSAGVTGASSRHSLDDTARRPPSVKAALSVSFGQRAPHRASTRDSSPVRRSATRDPRTADDQVGLEKIRDRVGKETGFFNNSNKQTASIRHKGRDVSRIKERNGELLGTESHFTSSVPQRDNEDEANIPCNHFDGLSSHRIKVGEVRSKRGRAHEKDMQDYYSRNSEKNKSRSKRERDREYSRSHSPARDKNDVDVCLMRTRRGLGSQGKLQDVYGDGSSKGSAATYYTDGTKGRSAEDVIHLGDGSWM